MTSHAPAESPRGATSRSHPERIDRWIAEYGDRVELIARSFGASGLSPEDLCRGFWLHILSKQSLHQVRNPRAWLSVACRRFFIRAVRAETRRRDVLESYARQPGTRRALGDPETTLEVKTDVSLPNGSGLKIAQALYEVCPDVPVLFSSGYVAIKIDRTTISPEFEQLSKPFEVEELVLRVHSMLR